MIKQSLERVGESFLIQNITDFLTYLGTGPENLAPKILPDESIIREDSLTGTLVTNHRSGHFLLQGSQDAATRMALQIRVDNTVF